MPNLQLYLGFIAAVTALMLIPGPNVTLIVANTITHGVRFGLLTLAGTCSAMIIQLTLTALGMTELLARSGTWFEWLRWIGVFYLIYLGVRQWNAPPVDLTAVKPDRKNPSTIYARAFFVSMTNPKTLFFYGAFFPQFVDPSNGGTTQLVTLSVTFLLVAVIVDSGWSLAAGRVRHLLASRGRLRNRLSGGVLIGAGVALATVRAK